MPRKARFRVRRFLNLPGHHGGAYILAEVADTSGRTDSYVESNVELEIADCSRRVSLEFPLYSASDRRNSLRKARLLASVLEEFVMALEAEATVAKAREAERRSYRPPSPAGIGEWMVNITAIGARLNDEQLSTVADELRPWSASAWGDGEGVGFMLTIPAACREDAPRIGEGVVRAAFERVGLVTNKLASEVWFVEG